MENILDSSILKEQQTQIIYGGFWLRFWAMALDTIIFIPTIALGFYNNLEWKSFPLMIFLLLLPLVYKPILELRYGTTIGKKAVGLWVVSLQYEKIKLKEALLRSTLHIVAGLLSLTSSIVLYNNPQFHNLVGFSAYRDVSILTQKTVWITYSILIVYLVDTIFLLLDKKKRSLHDLIGQTYIVKKLK